MKWESNMNAFATPTPEFIELGYNFLPNVSLFNGPFLYTKTRFPSSIACGDNLKLDLSPNTRSDGDFLGSLLSANVKVTEVCGLYVLFETKDTPPPSRRFQMKVYGTATKSL